MEIFNEFPFLRYAAILFVVLMVVLVFLLIISSRAEPESSNVIRFDETRRRTVTKPVGKGGKITHQGRLTDTGFDDSSSWRNSNQ